MDRPTTTGTPPVPPAYVSPVNGGFPPVPTVPVPPKPVFTTDRRDMTAACILLGLAILSANFALFGGFHLGFAIGYVALLLCGIVYLWGKALRPTAYSTFCAAAAVLAGGVFVWHNDGVTRFLLYAVIVYLTMQALVDATGCARYDRGTVASVGDVLSMLLLRPLNNLGAALTALFRANRNGQVEKRRCGGVLLGLLCALPVLAVLLPLLIGADAAFEGLMQRTILGNLWEGAASLAVGLVLFCVLFARLFSLRYALHPAASAPSAERRGIDKMAINAFLGVICGVYVLFLFSQLAYFFGGFSGILPADYTVAEYARRGFFEMCAICAINLLLTAFVLFLSRKEQGKAPRSTRVLCLFVLLFSIGMVAVALAKMWLYVGSFGMTRLRILTSVFMLMLGMVLLFVCIRLFAVRFPYMRAAVIAVVLLGLTTAYVDVDTVIARYNVRAYQSDILEEIDVDTLRDLSDGATPYLLELCDDKNTEVAKQAVIACYWKLLDVAEIDEDGTVTPLEEMDFRSYNVDSYRARRLLLDNAEKVRDLYNAHRAYESSSDAHTNAVLDLFKGYMGDYYYTQQIDKLGLVAVKGSSETAIVFHAYYPDSLTSAEVTLGERRIVSPWLCKPNELGIYIVTGDEVLTLEDAYYSDIVYMEDVYALLPGEMTVENTAW